MHVGHGAHVLVPFLGMLLMVFGRDVDEVIVQGVGEDDRRLVEHVGASGRTVAVV